jgi:single-stranded DNA-binding protein
MPVEQGNNNGGVGNKPEAPKVRVRGRIGQLPQFRSVPDKSAPDKDLLIGNFSIAEHPEPGDRNVTVWHEVATFGERSRRLQEQFDAGELRVGQEVEVVGTLHRRDRPTKDGGTKTVEQIYAYAVKPVAQETPDTKPGTGPSDLQTPPGSWGKSE